jgi:hypothetical protein
MSAAEMHVALRTSRPTSCSQWVYFYRNAFNFNPLLRSETDVSRQSERLCYPNNKVFKSSLPHTWIVRDTTLLIRDILDPILWSRGIGLRPSLTSVTPFSDS